MSHVVGHSQQKKILSAVFEGKIPHHVFVFHGPRSVGKFLLAKSFACSVVRGDNRMSWNIPEYFKRESDIMILSPQTQVKKGVESSTGITIGMVRDFRKRLSLTKGSDSCVIIIDQAQEMTVQAQNALLKVIEEPNDSTYIFFVTSQPDKLLPTIRSRAMMMHFDTLDYAQMEQIPKITPDIISNSFGRPGYAVKMIESQVESRRVADSLQVLKDVRGRPMHERLSLASDFTKDIVATKEMLELWTLRVYEVAHSHEKYDVLLIASKIEKTLQELRDSNVNKKLLIESLMISL